VARGLAGEADGAIDGSAADGEIRLSEFHAYLTRKIGAAAARRGRKQRPLLLPGEPRNDSDFVLAKTDAGATQELIGRIRAEKFHPDKDWLSEIAKGWTRLHTQSKEHNPDHGSFHGVAPGMVFLETAQRQHWQRQMEYCLAGSAYQSNRDPSPQFGEPQPSPALPPVSLPLALRGAELTSERQTLAEQALQPSPATPAADGKPLPEPPTTVEMAAVLWAEAREPAANLDAIATKLQRIPPAAGGLPLTELRTLVRFGRQNARLPTEMHTAGRDAVRLLLDCRDQAERAAFVAGEPRVLPFVRKSLNDVDQRRRVAEDRAFGNTVDPQELDKINEDFAGLRGQAEGVAQTLNLRDRIWADLPDLLEWASCDQALVPEAQSLLEALAQLEKALDVTTDAGKLSSPESLMKLGLQAEAPYTKLIEKFDSEVQAIVSESALKGNIGLDVRLSRLLAAPLGDLSSREKIWNKYLGIFDEVSGDASAKSTSAPPDVLGQERNASVGLLDRWLRAVEQLRNEPSAAGQSTLERLDALTSAALPGDPAREPAKLARQEQRARALAPWLVLDSKSMPANQPPLWHHQWQLCDYCLWQAERHLNDFLGNDDIGLSAIEAQTDKPYCERAAEALLSRAKEFFPNQPELPLLAQRQSEWKSLQSVFDASKPASVTIPSGKTEAELSGFAASEFHQGLPRGERALNLGGHWKQVRLPGSESALLSNSAGYLLGGVNENERGLPAKVTVTLAEQEAVATVQLGYYYRGHATTLRVNIERQKPLYVIDSVPPGDTGSIRVESPFKKASIILLLDCSGSMNNPKDEPGNRMDRAKEAVFKSVSRMLETPGTDIEISVVLFAHRRGSFDWPAPGKIAQLLWNDKFGDNDLKVTLDNDFQTVWNSTQPLAALDEVLQSVKPMGFTPLYGAMEDTLAKGFKRVAADRSRHMIVVSDGADDVPTLAELIRQAGAKPGAFELNAFNPPWDQQYNANAQARARKIRDALTSVNVYFFDITGGGALGRVKADLGLRDDAIAAVDRAEQLVPKLLDRINLFDYTIARDIDLNEGNEGEVGAQTKDFTLSPDRYTISLRRFTDQSKEFSIQGGESLAVQIQAAKPQPRLQFLGPEDPPDGSATGSIAANYGDEAGVRLDYRVTGWAQPPSAFSEKPNREFWLRLENTPTGEFTPRPAGICVEVTPLDAQGKRGVTYLFIDHLFEKGQRVPALKLVVPDPLANVQRAEINVWLRMAHEYGLFSEVGESNDNPSGERLMWQLEPAGSPNQVVTILEQPADGKFNLEGTFFVSPRSMLRLESVIRTYYENGRVKHQFHYSGMGSTARDEARRKVFRVAPLVKWKAGAAKLEAPLLITLPKSN
jgi:hypothetical protein